MALTKDRNTKRRDGKQFNDPVAASTRIFAGSLMCLNAAGDAVPGSVSTTLKARGVAQEQVDNLSGAAGAARIESSVVCSRSPTVRPATKSPAPTLAPTPTSSTTKPSPRPMAPTPVQ